MLLRFSVRNHRSLRDRQELSLVAAGSIKDNPEGLIRPEGLDLDPGVLPVAVIYGANASGKSNVLHALEAMSRAVLDSYRKWKPDAGVHRWPFYLEEQTRAQSSEFEVDIVVGGVRYQYGFEADDQLFLREWLRAWPRGRRQTWFEREKDQPIRFGRALSGGRAIEAVSRPNSLFLSAAVQAGHQQLSTVAGWFERLRLARRENEAARLEYAVSQVRKRGWEAILKQLLHVADFGISKLEVFEQKLSEGEQQRVSAILQAIQNLSPEEARAEAARPRQRLVLKHRARDQAVALTMEDESDGTLVFLSLVYPVLDALTRGEVLLVDELESSMHPELARALIDLFLDPGTNTGAGQLICTTHNTQLMRTKGLRRDSVWFTEKGTEGATRLFPLTDYRTRKKMDLESGYLQGRFGGVPVLGDFREVARLVGRGAA